MGLILFPGDGDPGSPDASWSCTGFAAFRRCLAEAEGFDLAEMRGFGGDRPWTDVPTPLAPLLDHPDVGGDDLSPPECASVLARLETLTAEWTRVPGSSPPPTHTESAHRLSAVLRVCVTKDVPLSFA